MFFNELEKFNNSKFDNRLLWEFKVDNTFDWQKMKKNCCSKNYTTWEKRRLLCNI